MANNLFDNILKAADCVIEDPSTPVRDVCAKLGVPISPRTGYIVGNALLLYLNPFGPMGLVVAGFISKAARKRREAEEKERMKNEIIRKQQAIIAKLKEQNSKNQQEIKNLRDTLSMLENAMTQLDVA